METKCVYLYQYKTFSEVLYRENFLVFRGNLLEANFPFLNYP